MGSKLKDIITYILLQHSGEWMSIVKLERFIFLSDWISAFNFSRVITSEKWTNGINGPKNENIIPVILNNSDLYETKYESEDDEEPYVVTLKNEINNIDFSLDNHDISCIDHLLKMVDKMDYTQIIGLTNTSYPVATTSRHEEINIIKKAKEFKTKIEEVEEKENEEV